MKEEARIHHRSILPPRTLLSSTSFSLQWNGSSGCLRRSRPSKPLHRRHEEMRQDRRRARMELSHTFTHAAITFEGDQGIVIASKQRLRGKGEKKKKVVRHHEMRRDQRAWREENREKRSDEKEGAELSDYQPSSFSFSLSSPKSNHQK
ncbi:hypothetical protein J5N97_003223 [Dioscorea zingiberensis]|uniref:Uncharacterized protein n=1 Tax=Dioscorea zingiberensis TaxID=325984 RepID=A0A9D5D5S9_9LILI|nr:hypothetical protein J5N97_003223 [Dioscorea zingiberensis]